MYAANCWVGISTNADGWVYVGAGMQLLLPWPGQANFAGKILDGIPHLFFSVLTVFSILCLVTMILLLTGVVLGHFVNGEGFELKG